MIEIPQRLLGEALLKSAVKFPNKTAIISKSTEYTYAQFSELSNKLALYLVSSGLKKGDRVAIFMSNSWQCVLSIYAITLAGGVFLVINPQTKADKIQFILKDSGAKMLLFDGVFADEIHLALDRSIQLLKGIYTGTIKNNDFFEKSPFENFEQILESKNITGNLPRIIPSDLAALIYTSGSTGFPKGVMMTHLSMVFASWSLIEYLRLDDSDRIILLLPLAFDYGLYQLLMSVTIGGSLLLEQSFTFQATIYKQIETYKPTVFPGVPTIYAMMIATHKSSGISFDCIKKVTNTAAALPAEFIPDLKKIFPNALIFKMYGLTECKRVCYLEPELVDIKSTSVGKAIPGTEVFLLDAENKLVPPGGKGILHIRGPHVMMGYWNNEKLSKEMLREGSIPGERVLCSHDWFSMDEEGFLYFLGRTDDIIKTRGEKVSPVEIENIIYKIPGIKEVAIIGVPDEIFGEAIIGFVTSHGNANLSEKDVIKECKSKLELFMIPKSIHFIQEMPKSSNGKIDKKVLKKQYMSNE